MKRIVRNIVTCLIMALATGIIFTGCLNWLNDEQKVEPPPPEPPEPLRITIEEGNELFGIVDSVKILSFDDLYLYENKGDLIEISLIKQYYSHNRLYAYSLYLPEVVNDEKLIRMSDAMNHGKVSNYIAKVACLQYFRVYNKENNCIGYYEWGYRNPDDDSWFTIQLWYADNAVTYTSDDGTCVFSLQKGWNRALEGYGEEFGRLHGYRMGWRYTEL